MRAVIPTKVGCTAALLNRGIDFSSDAGQRVLIALLVQPCAVPSPSSYRNKSIRMPVQVDGLGRAFVRERSRLQRALESPARASLKSDSAGVHLPRHILTLSRRRAVRYGIRLLCMGNESGVGRRAMVK